ncbi:MAG TPA: ATP-binding protein [Oceanospirillaceae bacterium]|nr:ATP-binding protein [Oceanospirillaceae bacterium]
MTHVSSMQSDQVLKSLRAGVVPADHIDLIQVGRAGEQATLAKDILHISKGGSSVRFVTGAYGTGKTFIGELTRQQGIKQGLVVASAALSPDKRLQARTGETRNLYSALVRSFSTKARPDGTALVNIVERFILTTLREAHVNNVGPEQHIAFRLGDFEELAGGFDFIKVIQRYWLGLENQDEALKSTALRWLRGEFSSLTDARAALGVRSIIDYRNFFSGLKMLCQFVRMAGYPGLLICLDEMVALHELSHKQARINNFNEILNIVNDCLQGQVQGMGFVFLGTPEFVYDDKKGLFSMPALKSRLAPNVMAKNGLKDVSGPVIELQPLQEMEMDDLLHKLRDLQAYGNAKDYLIDDMELWALLLQCRTVYGDQYFLNPRLAIKTMLDLLAVSEQNPQADVAQLIAAIA